MFQNNDQGISLQWPLQILGKVAIFNFMMIQGVPLNGEHLNTGGAKLYSSSGRKPQTHLCPASIRIIPSSDLRSD
jgi:hypothetical protein